MRQKPREVCITEDVDSIDLGWLENGKLNCVKNGTRCFLQVGVRDWESQGTSPSRTQKGFCGTVAEIMDNKMEGEDEIRISKRPRVAERSSCTGPVRDRVTESRFLTSMNFFGQSANHVVASVFEDSEAVRRATVRRHFEFEFPLSRFILRHRSHKLPAKIVVVNLFQ